MPKPTAKKREVKGWAIFNHRGKFLRVRELKRMAEDDVHIENQTAFAGRYAYLRRCVVKFISEK